MPDIEISGVTVKFPFEPYNVQRNYMESVIKCLDNSQNGMLESPTGTGKTLCLLCATLAWVEHNKVEGIEPPKVIYASRTHSQIAQAMKELKRSEYNYVKATVIGSRDQLCTHPELKTMTNADKTLKCKDLRKREGCKFHHDHTSKQMHPEFQKNIMDVEDLVRAGLKHECCPYYVAKESAAHTSVIFMPYNYLIDPLMRGAVLKNIRMSNSIVILDESHNVPSVCEKSASTSITSTEIIIALRDMKYIVENVSEETFQKYQTKKNDARILKASLHKLVSEINELQLGDNGTGTHSGNNIFALLEKANIRESNGLVAGQLIEILFDSKGNKAPQPAPQGIGLRAIANFLQVVYTSQASRLKDRIDSCYVVYIKEEPSRTTQDDDSEYAGTRKIVNFWCFSPAFGIDNIIGQNIRSLIMTSGTLSPFQPIINEMDISVPVQLSNSHVIERHQVYAEVCKVGVKNEKMDGAHKNCGNVKYIASLGASILEVAKVVPDGLLIFFKSYTIMEKYTNFWRSNGIWEEIQELKPVFIEPRIKKDLKPKIREYNASINQNKGAIFMAVLRGKISEGLDFADMYGRAVVIIGIPYGPFVEPEVVLKKQCLDRNRTRENQLPSGDEWYGLEAVRAVNQAIGRVIRHKNDYGAILLLDDRFSESNIQKDISSWIKHHLSHQSSYPTPFGAVIDSLKNFFKRAEQMLPKPVPKEEAEFDFSDDDEPGPLAPIQAESIKTEPMDFNSKDNEDDGMLVNPQVTLHERKRKTSANSSVSDDAKPQPSTYSVCKDIQCDDLKRKKMNGLDINMNACDENESKCMENNMPPFVKDDLEDSAKYSEVP